MNATQEQIVIIQKHCTKLDRSYNFKKRKIIPSTKASVLGYLRWWKLATCVGNCNCSDGEPICQFNSIYIYRTCQLHLTLSMSITIHYNRYKQSKTGQNTMQPL